MSANNKKQRREAKRKVKRREIRRRESISPVKRLADAPGEAEVWMSEDFEFNGQMQIFVYKRAAGLTGMAAFLIDRGVVGLKDAWIRMHIDHVEFDDAIKESRERGIGMRHATVDEARRWVAGGLRWARDNGMRLPTDLAKAAAFIGGVGDWQSADVSGFVMEFAGHPQDLRQRLIGEPLESFLRRNDIEFVFSTDAPYMDQRTGDYVNSEREIEDFTDEELEQMADELPDEEIDQLIEKLNPAVNALAAQTRSWLVAKDEAPSDELVEAWTSVMLARMVSKAAAPDADEEEVGDLGLELLQGLSSRLEESRVAEHHRAVEQVLRHLETDSNMMRETALKYLHVDEPEGAEQTKSPTPSP